MKSACIGVLVLAAVSAGAAQAPQDPLSGARELYASAAYEDALTTLTRLHQNDPAPPVVEQIDEYRAFCLFALGRVNEAQSVAEALITKNPMLELNSADASPRIAAMFSDVRKRMLPTLIRDQYRSARGAIDHKELAAAEPQLRLVRRMLDEAEKLGVLDPTLADMRVLTDGFLDLAKAATAAGPAAKDAAAAPASSPAAAAAAPHAPEGTAVKTAQIFDTNSFDVVGPVTLKQAFPAVPAQLGSIMTLAKQISGKLDVLIDENGDVEKAVVRDPINAIYDKLVVAAARTWKYKPATKNGVPVKYLKTIAVNLK